MSRYIDAEVMEQRVREAMVNSPHMIPPLIKFIRGIPPADVAFGTLKEHFADVGKMVEPLPTADVTESVGEYNGLTATEQLNLYRNKYYSDGNATEKGIIANAINDVFPSLLKGGKS